MFINRKMLSQPKKGIYLLKKGRYKVTRGWGTFFIVPSLFDIIDFLPFWVRFTKNNSHFAVGVFMTKAGLEVMIAALKDRCKESLSFQISPSCAKKMLSPANEFSKTLIAGEQLISLTAMVSYVAHMTDRSEFRVERELSDHFCVANPKCLARDQYDEAIRYMMSLVPASTKC